MPVGSSTLPVYNTTSETIPPRAAIRIAGRNSDGVWLAAKPNANNLANVVFNGPSPISPEHNGQAVNCFPCPAAYSADNDDAASPAVDEEWGVRANEWLLFKDHYGFTIKKEGVSGVASVVKADRTISRNSFQIANVSFPALDQFSVSGLGDLISDPTSYTYPFKDFTIFASADPAAASPFAIILEAVGVSLRYVCTTSNPSVEPPDEDYWRVCYGERGAWDSTVAYVVGNLVLVSGTTYQCILANTNQTPPNATYWVACVDRGLYVYGDSYDANDLVALPSLAEATMSGPAKCRIDLTDTAHTYAAPAAADYDKLLSQSAAGPAKILWSQGSAATQLNGAINASVTSILVDLSDDFPEVPFVAIIESENVNVTEIDEFTWTVTRGYNGTTAATHADNTAVTFKSGTVDAVVLLDMNNSAVAASIVSINGDATAAQVFSVGTSGLDFAITDTGSGTLCWNLPDASRTARGVVNITTQSIEGIKTFYGDAVDTSLPAVYVQDRTISLIGGAIWDVSYSLALTPSRVGFRLGNDHVYVSHMLYGLMFDFDLATVDALVIKDKSGVTHVGATAGVNGLVFQSGLLISGSISGISLTAQVSGTLPVANGGLGINFTGSADGTIPVFVGGVFTVAPGHASLSGSGAPAAGLGYVGDTYINTDNGDFYWKT